MMIVEPAGEPTAGVTETRAGSMFPLIVAPSAIAGEPLGR